MVFINITTCMSIRIFLITVLYGITVSVYAQEDISRLKKDSLKTISNEYLGSDNPTVTPFAIKEEMPEIKVETDIPQKKIPEIKYCRPFHMPYYTDPSPMFYSDYITGGLIAPNLYGYGSQSTLPGRGGINEASLMYRYDINDFWEIQGGVNATKYHFPFHTGQAFGAAGTIIYRPTDKLSFRAFGSYAPVNAYEFHMNSYGGTIGYEFNDKWGVEVGAERVYDPMKRSWDTRPIAIPYFKFNKTKIGVDVGGILYEIIRNAKFKNNQGGGPIIMPER